MKKIISTSDAPSAIGPYNQAVTFDKLIFTSGQIALCPETMEIVGNDIATQAKQVMENLKNVLKVSGSSFENAIKTVCYLSDMKDFADFNEVYGEYFNVENAPARSCVAVKTLPKDVLVEVEVIAYKN